MSVIKVAFQSLTPTSIVVEFSEVRRTAGETGQTIVAGQAIIGAPIADPSRRVGKVARRAVICAGAHWSQEGI